MKCLSTLAGIDLLELNVSFEVRRQLCSFVLPFRDNFADQGLS
jgi:hypothetical protein